MGKLFSHPRETPELWQCREDTETHTHALYASQNQTLGLCDAQVDEYANPPIDAELQNILMLAYFSRD